MILADPKNREEWIKERFRGIGGSDAGAIVGANQYKNNVELWRQKMGLERAVDISGKPAVEYGKRAEAPLREIFALDFPQYEIDYHEYRMYANDTHNFMYATLDGELTDCQTGTRGVLEIKTTTIQNNSQWEQWNNRVPQSYYIQVLHQLIATGWDFAVLKAHIRYFKQGDIFAATRHYFINREDVLNDMKYLIQEECKFWEYIRNKKCPALILPQI